MRSKTRDFLAKLPNKENKNFIENLLVSLLSVYKSVRHCFYVSDNKFNARLYSRIRYLEKSVIGGSYRFVRVEDLIIWSNEWIKKLGSNYDIVIGIPRSGLLVANLIALKLGKPLTTPELFAKGEYWKSKLINNNLGGYKKILLVDDSVSSGRSIEESYEVLRSLSKDLVITKAALIVSECSKNFVDTYYKVVPQPRLFEWNLLHAKKGKVALDLDGVLCENCPPGVDTNEQAYVRWISSARPYLIPTFEIDAIISCRLEKYRSFTEQWLVRHNVRYKELVLWDLDSKREREGKYSLHKIEALFRIKPDIYWESNSKQAEEIWKATRIPTLCVDDMVLYS